MKAEEMSENSVFVNQTKSKEERVKLGLKALTVGVVPDEQHFGFSIHTTATTGGEEEDKEMYLRVSKVDEMLTW